MKSVKYSLVPALMPGLKDTGKYIAQVQIRGSLGFNEMADRMIAQGSTITKSDILAVFENLAVALETAMLEGFRVNFGGVFDMFPSVTGTFDGIVAPFDPAVNTVNIRTRCGARVRNSVLASASVERVVAAVPAPLPLAFADLSSATTNATITPGNIGTVAGQLLKFNPEAADEGIFLIPTAGGDTVQMTVTQRNQPKELVFLVPTLTPGADYRLEVRARLNGSDTLRSGRLGVPLTVAPLP